MKLELLSSGIAIIIIILKLSIGLNTPVLRIREVLPKWRQIFWSVFIIVTVAPLVVVGINELMNNSKGALITMCLLAAAPGAPLAVIKVFKVRGDFLEAFTIQIIVQLLSILTIPAVLYFFHMYFDLEVSIHWTVLGKQLLLYVFLPLIAGLVIRGIWTDLAVKAGMKLSRIANVLLMLLGLILIFFTRGFLFGADLHDLLSFALFSILTIGISHLIGSVNRDERIITAILTSARHLGIVLFIAMPFFSLGSIMQFIVPYIIVSMIVVGVYMRMVKK